MAALAPESVALQASGSDVNPNSMSSTMLRVLDMAFSSSPRGAAPPAPQSPLGCPRRSTQARIARKKTPDAVVVQKQEQELRDILIRDDGSLRGGSIQKVLVHVAFVLGDPEFIDCFLHCYRNHCTSAVLLKELTSAYQDRLDLSFISPEEHSENLAQFLTSWVDLYFEKDFAEGAMRGKLLKLIERIIDPQQRNKLKLLVLRHASAMKSLRGLNLSLNRRYSSGSAIEAQLALVASQPCPLPSSPSEPLSRLASLPALQAKSSSPPSSLKKDAKAKEQQRMPASIPISRPLSTVRDRAMSTALPSSASAPLRRPASPASSLTSSGQVSTWIVALRDEANNPPPPPATNSRPSSARRRGFSWMGSAAALEESLDDEDLSNNGRRSILLNHKAEDIAKQLTMVEFTMYENVSASEFQDNAWQSKNKHTQAPFCTAMVNFSNKVTAWIEHEILSRHGTKQVSAMERAIRLAEKCRELRNYNGLMEVFSALSQVTITRLKDSWTRIDPKLRAYFADLEEFLTPIGNFRKFREEIKASLELEVPVLPYVGTFLRDVLFANDGNPTTVQSGSMKLVNFDKIQVVGNQINYFNRFKKHKFTFPLQVQLRDMLIALPSQYEAPMTRERALSAEVKI